MDKQTAEYLDKWLPREMGTWGSFSEGVVFGVRLDHCTAELERAIIRVGWKFEWSSPDESDDRWEIVLANDELGYANQDYCDANKHTAILAAAKYVAGEIEKARTPRSKLDEAIEALAGAYDWLGPRSRLALNLLRQSRDEQEAK